MSVQLAAQSARSMVSASSASNLLQHHFLLTARAAQSVLMACSRAVIAASTATASALLATVSINAPLAILTSQKSSSMADASQTAQRIQEDLKLLQRLFAFGMSSLTMRNLEQMRTFPYLRSTKSVPRSLSLARRRTAPLVA